MGQRYGRRGRDDRVGGWLSVFFVGYVSAGEGEEGEAVAEGEDGHGVDGGMGA